MLFMIIAHRGYAKNHPENTIPAFDAAFNHGAGAIETDIRLTKDGFVVISHNDIINLNDKRIVLSSTLKKDIKEILDLDNLFDYIKSRNEPFFLEVKTLSKILIQQVIKKISENNLWDRVHLIGFSSRIKIALEAQNYYPKLLVDQIVMMPYLHYIKKPKRSYAVFFGWLDGIKYSEQVFKRIIPQPQVSKLKELYESLGFKVYAGVLNREDGIRYFHESGICDIFTDEVEKAVKILQTCPKPKQQF